MLKKQKKTNTDHKYFSHVKTVGEISEYKLKNNGLRVLYMNIPQTGVVTTNIVYLVGSRDERVGETGVAHMLEHMLFKPTKKDKELRQDSAILKLEREVGGILNANTWSDRTSYYLSTGVEHFSKILEIESERMRNVLLIDKEFLPERTNVLSEFDMYNGDPHFALSVEMVCSAFHSHPYGHETIGFREDIEAYTVDKLQYFYNHYYRPNNAVLVVIGDVDLEKTLTEIYEKFSHLDPEPNVEIRPVVKEPKQEGLRRIEIVRPGTINMLAIGAKHPGFPSVGWFETMIALKILVEGEDSVLQNKLVDTGLASVVSFNQQPTKDMDLATIFITLTKKSNHQKMEELVRKIISEIDDNLIKKKLRTIIAKTVSTEVFNRDSSLDIASELTEYISAGNWAAYFETEALLKSITVKQIRERLNDLFVDSALTIGAYKSF